MDTQNNRRDYGTGGIAFVGCIMVAVGIIWMVRPEFVLQGAIVGCGVGFIVMAFLSRTR